MTNKLSLKNLTLMIIFICLFIVGLFGGRQMPLAFAEYQEYSSVLSDLQKDKSFSVANYPELDEGYLECPTNKHIQVIQIAESVNNELFVYAYQPCEQIKQMIATSINISVKADINIEPKQYDLQLLNSDGVFFKYLVKDFTVNKEPTRYYGLISIFRLFDEILDSGVSHDNTITEISYGVSKQYTFSTLNGNPYCSVKDIETITVTDKFVGFCRYKDGFKLYAGACDNHFVAFNTDKPIDTLMEADVYYVRQDYSWSFVPMAGEKETFGEKTSEYSFLSYTDDKVVHNGGGLFAATYKWDTIETVEQFIKSNDMKQTVYAGALIDVDVADKITDDGIKALKGKKWVLRFTTTNYSLMGNSGFTQEQFTLVGDVTILRLKFKTDGITYNLGVIDNKQSGSDDPINDEDISVKNWLDKLCEWLESVTGVPAWLWKTIICLLPFLILLPILSFAFPVVGNILIAIIKGIVIAVVWLFKGIFWVLSLPFKGIVALVRKIKDGG